MSQESRPSASQSGISKRATYFGWALAIIAVGLVWRLVPMGMPMPLVRHGGAALWGAMVYMLIGAAKPSSWGRLACVVVASLIAVAAEMVRLYHAPALDAFRGTLAGALLLGRVFAPINILVYGLGILVAAGLDWWIGGPRRPQVRRG